MSDTLSARINMWLGDMSHLEIVLACYVLTAIIVVSIVLWLRLKRRRLIRMLTELQADPGNKEKADA